MRLFPGPEIVRQARLSLGFFLLDLAACGDGGQEQTRIVLVVGPTALRQAEVATLTPDRGPSGRLSDLSPGLNIL
jgi:hypothetical protein